MLLIISYNRIVKIKFENIFTNSDENCLEIKKAIVFITYGFLHKMEKVVRLLSVITTLFLLLNSHSYLEKDFLSLPFSLLCHLHV